MSFFKNKFNFIAEKAAERKEIKKLMTSKSNFLLPGIYTIFGGAGKRIVFIKDDVTLAFIEKNMTHLVRENANEELTPSFFKQLISLISKINFKNEYVGNLEFNGQLFMLTRSKDLKIFDLSEQKVLTFLKNKDSYQKLHDSYRVFNDFFPMTYETFNDDEQFYIEKCLDFTPYRLLSVEEINGAINCIFANYKKYIASVANVESNSVSITVLQKQLREQTDNIELLQKLESILHGIEDRWPTIKCHGDLNFNNILLCDDIYFFIDWEDVDDYVFFFDIINFMFVEAMITVDFTYINDFMDGKYDDYFSEMFSRFNLQYDPRMKLVYIALYISERIIKFDLRAQNEYIVEILEKYLLTIVELEKKVRD